jgi:hypothetical protein
MAGLSATTAGSDSGTAATARLTAVTKPSRMGVHFAPEMLGPLTGWLSANYVAAVTLDRSCPHRCAQRRGYLHHRRSGRSRHCPHAAAWKAERKWSI